MRENETFTAHTHDAYGESYPPLDFRPFRDGAFWYGHIGM